MKHFLQRMMVFGAAVMLSMTISADDFQLPDPHFEDWSGEKFKNAEQPKYWHASNVRQSAIGLTFEFNFAHKEQGRSGYCIMAQDQEVGAAGVVEISPSYYSLGYAWAYLEGLNTNSATAGTYGGYAFKHRPDTVSVWIKRTGPHTADEDYHILFYSWTGTAKGASYRNKSGECTGVTKEDEESDIRIALDGNTCQTTTPGNQIAEAWVHERKQYNNWTNLRIPVYYLKSDIPAKCNLILSASNYPNYRSNSGLYEGNSLYVDDVELIYASTIQKLFINDKEWSGFNPNTSEVQVYELSENATDIPSIEARRGVGELTNVPNQSTTKTQKFPGRVLSGSEISIVKGDLESTPTVITVKSEDGKSTSTYRIQFKRAAGSNAKLASIAVNGTPIAGFASAKFNYTVELPYGTTTIPVVTAEKQEDEQTVVITQATSVNGTAKIVVTAANGTTKETYNITFKVGQLADNTLKDILVNGKSIPGFTPTQAIYKVSLPVGTTQMPTVKAVSAYPDGEQTIVYTAPAVIDGGQYQISVTTPGNTVAKVYKLNFKLEASSYKYLADLQVVGEQVARVKPAKANDQTAIDFTPDNMTYYVYLKMGASSMPEIKYTKGDEFQTVQVSEGGLDGTSRITVTAGNGDQAVYKLNFSTEKSTNSKLDGILIGGEPLEGFDPNVTSYSVQLPIGTTTLPEITPIAADEFQQIVVTTAGVNGVTRITVTAGNGSTTIYQIAFSVNAYTDNTLKSLTVEGYDIGFEPTKNEYWVNLPQGTTELPKVNYELQDPQFQTANERPLTSGLTGDYKITVRPQSGASRTYVIHFTLATSSNTALEMIYFDGKPMKCWNGTDSIEFDPEVLEYTHKLPEGESKLPTVTVKKGEDSQRVLNVLENKVQSITVTAESGATRTYTITFVVTVSANAYLDMIYLDKEPLEGFRRDSFEYVKQLDSITCPKITVDKAAGQQVTITAPYAAGKAYIKVVAGTGDFSTYTIDFKAGAVASVRLHDILVNGVSIEGFDATTLNYEATYENSLPTVEGVTENDNQTVQVRWKGNTAYLYVSDKEGNQATYSVTFTRDPSGNNELVGIYEDFGEGAQLIGGFTKTKKHYSYDLPAGSALPVVTYEAAATAQVVFFGQLEYGKWGVTVEAENGDTTTYTVTYNILPYDDATLAKIFLDGDLLDGFQPNDFKYDVQLENGANLPKVTVESKPGQRVLIQSVGDSTQVFVYAESGRKNTYTINYTRKTSSNALLADILIDGVSIEGFAPKTFKYIDSLDRVVDGDTIKVIPNVFPIGQLSNQTITTYFSRLNGTTRINVVAEDGTEQDYFVEFPVRKLDNNKLRNLDIQHGEAVLSFRPDVTDYEVELPYEDIICPPLIIEKGETHQRVDIISRPVGDTTKVIVYAENGNPNTYNILFKREILQDENRLSMIRIVELDKELSLKDKNKRDFEVEMPYGSRTLTVEYAKNYTAQTVFVEPGGVNHPTVITVKANNGDVADEVYTIYPTVPTDDPAVLTEISVNGNPVENFDSNRFAYIANVTSSPVIRYKASKGAIVNVTIQTPKHWQAEVTYGEGALERTNTYNVWYYYNEDALPNGEFTEWTKAKYNNGQKPVGWQVVADAVNSQGTYSSGDEVKQNPTGVVYLHSRYPGLLGVGGMIPGFITTGTVTGKLGVAGSSTFAVSGGITFRNSPDTMSVRYKFPTVSDNNRIVYQLTGTEGYKELVHSDGSAISNYTILNMPLTEANEEVGSPSVMNIILNSYYIESGTIADGSSEMYVDWVRLKYNSTLTGAKVDNIDANLSGNEFTVDLDDPERIEIPVLNFTGEVDDQAQDVVWNNSLTLSDDGNFEIRKATIRNWAENGVDYSDYTLTVRRPLDTRNQLKDLLLDSVRIKDFSETNDTYEIKMSPSDVRLPDIMPIPKSSRQTIATSFDETTSTFTITVTPEKGEAKEYKVHFTTEWSDDTTLSGISAEGVDYQADKHEYTVQAEEMPVITFTKKSDMQLVSLVNGVITVTAEDGEHTGTYTINRAEPDYNPNGVISQFRYNNQPDDDNFGGNYTEKTEKRPEGAVFFTRAADRDSVVFVQTETNMTWTVPGASNIYIWTFKEDGVASSNADLAGLNVNEDPYQEFSADKTSYMITSDTTVVVEAVLAEAVQQLTTTISVNGDTITYVMNVTAEDGTTTKGYSMRITRQKHNINTLAGILVDGESIDKFDKFDPEKPDYTVVLPLPDDGVKRVKPQMPSITYIAGDERQQITLTPGMDDDPTIIAVRSEDGKGDVNEYNVTVVAENSHCTDLTGITVNGTALDHFEPGRHYYSTTLPMDEIEVDYTSDDRFQNVNIWREIVKAGQSYIYYLDVKAEDGTTSQYQVEIYIENQSNDAQLANIFLDRKAFVDFERALNDNPPLAFDPGSNDYKINLPAGTEILPEVSAQLKMPGQQVDIIHRGVDSILLHVTAVDKVSTNDYKLHFVVPLSKNANLDMIYINGDSLEGFDKEHYFYKVDLPVGTDKLPEVVGQQAEASQTVSKAEWEGMQATIKVQAEDPETRPSTYVVLFSFTQSDVDTLAMIYADGDTLDGFAPRTYYYKQTLPVGTTVFPNLEWVEGDDYQDVKLQTVSESAESLVRQIIVTAQSGKKATYTVAYEIAKSSVDTLQMIRVDRKPLEGFRSDVYEYFYHLSVEAAEVFADSLILVDCTLGDMYQDTTIVYVPETMSGKTLGYKTIITVTAQTGAQHIYTIHYPVDLSMESTLEMIYLNGVEINGFSDLRFNYREEIGMTDAIPVVTVTKKEEAQTVDIRVETDAVRIVVTAEDGTANSEYLITFERLKSAVTTLKEIILTNIHDVRLTSGEFPYRPDYYEYTVDLPYDGTMAAEEQLPMIDYVKNDEEQTVEIVNHLLPNGNIQVDVTVTAPNGEDQAIYSITFHWLKPDDANLVAIILNGDTLNGFNPWITEYTYAHAFGSTETDFFTLDQVAYVLSDSLATATTSIREDGAITISVVAQSGFENPYIIRQLIAEDGDNALAWITLNNDTLEGFDPDVTFYTYYLLTGKAAPSVDAMPRSENAQEPSIREAAAGDTCLIICTAADGSERRYYIHFAISEIDPGLEPTANDVLIKRVPGAMQLFVTAIRQGISFALFNHTGKLMYEVSLDKVADPNYTSVTADTYDNDILVDVRNWNEGVLIDVNPNEVYIYTFFKSDSSKKIIKSGKIRCLP